MEIILNLGDTVMMLGGFIGLLWAGELTRTFYNRRKVLVRKKRAKEAQEHYNKRKIMDWKNQPLT